MKAVDGASLRPKRSDCARAWLAWAAFLAVIVVLVGAWPESRTVTPNYREACLRWFGGQDIYCEGPDGFLYFPHAAVLFAPFAYLPFGDVGSDTVSHFLSRCPENGQSLAIRCVAVCILVGNQVFNGLGLKLRELTLLINEPVSASYQRLPPPADEFRRDR